MKVKLATGEVLEIEDFCQECGRKLNASELEVSDMLCSRCLRIAELEEPHNV